jgi:hypothetical protein
MARWNEDYAALNADVTLNPHDAESTYWERKNETALILIKVDYANRPASKQAIVLTGWGTAPYQNVGDVVTLRADQSGRHMGRYLVRGIVAGDEVKGEVAHRKYRQYVMK